MFCKLFVLAAVVALAAAAPKPGIGHGVIAAPVAATYAAAPALAYSSGIAAPLAAAPALSYGAGIAAPLAASAYGAPLAASTYAAGPALAYSSGLGYAAPALGLGYGGFARSYGLANGYGLGYNGLY